VLEGIGVETMPLPDRDRALWILMTALARSGDREGAQRILQRLASGDGELSDRARSALETIASP
jgi:hypothetical protein